MGRVASQVQVQWGSGLKALDVALRLGLYTCLMALGVSSLVQGLGHAMVQCPGTRPRNGAQCSVWGNFKNKDS